MKKEKIKENIWLIISAAGLVCLHILILMFLDKRMPYLLDSDMSAELILGSILKQENRILTDSWFYSTELRFINTQLVYSFFLRFSDNWHMVRLLSDLVFHCLLSAGTIYLCKRAGCGRYGFITAVFMLLPMKFSYLSIMITGCFYVPHVCAEFFFFGMCLAYMKSESRKRKSLILVLASALAMCTGIGGLRQLVISFIPMTAVVFVLMFVSYFRDGMRSFRSSVFFRLIPFVTISFVMSGAGFVINNSYLSKRFHFMKFDDIHFTGLSTERIFQLFNDVLKFFGYSEEKISSVSVLCNILCAFILLVAVYSVVCGLKKDADAEYRLMTVYFLCNFCLFILIYAMTDMEYTDRYNIPVLVWIYPLTACALKRGKFAEAPKYTGKAVTVLLSGAVMLRGFLFMNDARKFNKPGELVDIAEYISQSEYLNGYATFWNSDILTELTNGKVEMYSWGSTAKGEDIMNTKDPDNLYLWLQKTSHASEPPQGKVFTLYRKEEAEYCLWNGSFRDEDMIYETDSFVVYGYESYDDMKNILKVNSEESKVSD